MAIQQQRHPTNLLVSEIIDQFKKSHKRVLIMNICHVRWLSCVLTWLYPTALFFQNAMTWEGVVQNVSFAYNGDQQKIE